MTPDVRVCDQRVSSYFEDQWLTMWHGIHRLCFGIVSLQEVFTQARIVVEFQTSLSIRICYRHMHAMHAVAIYKSSSYPGTCPASNLQDASAAG